LSPELWTSLIVAPEIYDINAGSIGRMHGDTKEATCRKYRENAW
jgi:hypothetical protein